MLVLILRFDLIPPSERMSARSFSLSSDVAQRSPTHLLTLGVFADCCAGIPDHPSHLRPLSYSLLLQTQPPQKGSWKGVIRTQRRKYHELVERYMRQLEDLPAPSIPLGVNDKLLKCIAGNVERAIHRFPYLEARADMSENSPLSPPATDDSFDDSVNGHASSSKPTSGSTDEEDGAARSGQGKGKEKLLCRRAAMKRLEMIGEAEYRWQHERCQTATVAGSSGTANGISPSISETTATVPLPPPSNDIPPFLSPRITLSTDAIPAILPRLEGRRPAPLHTPHLSLSPPAPLTDSTADSSASSPITLLSPKPIPTAGSLPFASISGRLLQSDTHAEVVVRILFIFAKCNPDLHIAGVSEILAILYSTYLEIDLAPLPKKRHRAGTLSSTGHWAEEQTYWALEALVERFRFIISDAGRSGDDPIKGETLPAALGRMARQLKFADEQLWTILHQRDLLPTSPLYAYRWLATVYSQDMSPRAVLPIWDYILAESYPDPGSSPADALIDVGVALLSRCKPLVMGYAPSVAPGPRTKAGLWADTNDKPLPEDRDITRDLEILRSPPLSQVGGTAAILDLAYQLRTARLVDRMDQMASFPPAGPSRWSLTRARVANSDRAASISRASSNLTASMMSSWSSATKAVSNARLPSGPMPSSVSTTGIFSSRDHGPESQEDTYTSLPSTPRTNSRTTFSPPMGSGRSYQSPDIPPSTPDRVSHTARKDSVASTASVSSLQDRLAALTATTPPTLSPSGRLSTGPRRLILSSSAKRFSAPAEGFAMTRSSSSTSSRSQSPTKQRSSLPASVDQGTCSFPSALDSGPNGSQDATLSPPVTATLGPGLYRTMSSSSGGLYRVLSGEAPDPTPDLGMTDDEERQRGEEGGLYKVGGRAPSPSVEDGVARVRGPRAAKSMGPRVAL